MRKTHGLVLTLFVALVGCGSSRHSAAGFSLPVDGDPERGKSVFLDMRCYDCHKVSGMNLPAPTTYILDPVMLGGETLVEMTDGYLVASVINPSVRIALHRDDVRQSDGKSRMPEFDNLTVRQLTDLVAFLQSRYTLRSTATDIHRF